MKCYYKIEQFDYEILKTHPNQCGRWFFEIYHSVLFDILCNCKVKIKLNENKDELECDDKLPDDILEELEKWSFILVEVDKREEFIDNLRFNLIDILSESMKREYKDVSEFILMVIDEIEEELK